MADKTTRDPIAIANASIASTDLFHVIDDPAGTPINKKITVASVFNAVPTFLGLNSVVTYTAAGAVALTEAISLLNADNATTAMTIANSTTTGQFKNFAVLNVDAVVDVDFTATLGAGVTFTFQTIGENAMFLWSGAAWVLVSLSGNVVVTNYTNLTTADVT